MYFFSQPIIFAKGVRQEWTVINWTTEEWDCLDDYQLRQELLGEASKEKNVFFSEKL